jgi:hypothetical protein
MSCEIIQISAFTRPARPVSENHPSAEATAIGNRLLTARQRRREGKPELPPPATETAKNTRIRTARRDAWWDACRVSEYWRARMDWQAALSTAQLWNVAGSSLYPRADGENRQVSVDTWRASVAKQLLTPAPDLGAVAWKRAKLKGRDFSHLPIKAARVERAIADDLAFLTAHPARKPMSNERKEERRNFNEAMRRRIKDIAAARDIPDDEIRPVLSLRHRHIGEFATKYSVNFEWLLEGEGRIFKKDPIRLSPNMTGNEFAAVVTTLPMADRQAIGTMLRELVQESDQ